MNPKRKFQDPPLSEEERTKLAGSIRYKGSPYHKEDPGDFGLTPPSAPRPDKTLCDHAKIFTVAEARALLERGVRKGLTSDQWRGSFPQNIWSVSDAGIPFEAQLENQVAGEYHGYPLQENDPWRDAVLERWRDDD